MSGYAAALRHRGLPAVMTASLLGRLPLGMYSVAILLACHAAGLSYRWAGASVSAYLVGVAAGTPVLTGYVDRRGPSRLLVVCAACHLVAAAGLLLLLTSGWPLEEPRLLSIGLTVVTACVLGLTMPPLTATSRAVWTRRFRGDLLRMVLSLDAVIGEAVFVLGPLLVSASMLGSSPRSALAVACLLAALGAAGFAAALSVTNLWTPGRSATDSTEAAHSPPISRWRRRRAWKPSPLRTLLVMQTLLFGGFALVEVGVLARAAAGGRPAVGGTLLAVWAGSSAVGAWGWGARRWPGPPQLQLPALLTMAATATALSAIPDTPWGLGLVLVPAGIVLAPAAVSAQTLVAASTRPASRARAFGWMTTSAQIGSSAGMVCAGSLVDGAGPAAVLLSGGLCIGFAATSALLGRTTPAATVATVAQPLPPGP